MSGCNSIISLKFHSSYGPIVLTNIGYRRKNGTQAGFIWLSFLPLSLTHFRNYPRKQLHHLIKSVESNAPPSLSFRPETDLHSAFPATAMFVLPSAATGTGRIAGGSACNAQPWLPLQFVKQAHLPNRRYALCQLFPSVRHCKHFIRCVATIGMLMGAVIQILIQCGKLPDVPMSIENQALGFHNVDDFLHGRIDHDDCLNCGTEILCR